MGRTQPQEVELADETWTDERRRYTGRSAAPDSTEKPEEREDEEEMKEPDVGPGDFDVSTD